MPESSPSTLDVVTLIVAILGIVLAGASLAWQAASFMLAGSRVRVKLRRGALRRGASGGLARLAGPLDPSESDYEMMRQQGFTDDVLIAEVRNVGRMAVSVESVSLDAEDGWGFAHPGDPENPALPHRLEAGSRQSWHVAIPPLQKVVDRDKKARKAWMTVELGTGKALRTKDEAWIRPSADPLLGPEVGFVAPVGRSSAMRLRGRCSGRRGSRTALASRVR